MSLKQDIVIVNEFSTKLAKGGGTRGGTPGNYVLRYMARNGATEDMAPIRMKDYDAYVTRYMARHEATERLDDLVNVKKAMTDVKGLGGIAFGQTGSDDIGDVSMSDRKVRRVSKDIQKAFEDGKTVLKTVISFDTDYLKRTGVVPDDLEIENKGDFRSNIDQMKLRLAVMNGMKKLSRNFDDLCWCGVVQVDTLHVHCHLCMVDKGEGNLAANGQQKGKLNENMKRVLRRGIDTGLDDMQPIRTLSAGVAYDRRNARCFVKKFTHEAMAMRSLPQFLIACLPSDKRLWRASTHNKEMKKANTIAREYVKEILSLPGSGYDKALEDIDVYARSRMDREGLTGEEYRKFVNNGKERLMDDCVNGIYSVLKTIPDEELDVRTPMLDIMSMEYKDMASESGMDAMLEFGFKLRSYSSRLNHHKKEKSKYREAKMQYDEAKEAGMALPMSAPLRAFYETEEEYNAMLMAKYQHFLAFLPSDDEYKEKFDDLMDYRDRLRRMRLMMDDKSMRRRSAESAEDYGKKVYDMTGGRYAVSMPSVLEDRYLQMQKTYEEKVSDFKSMIEDEGLILDDDMKVSKGPAYEFDDVKALDLHHLSYDFPADIRVSQKNIDAFVKMADVRYRAYAGAVEYLEETDQSEYIVDLPGKDVMLMKKTAEQFKAESELKSMRESRAERIRRMPTVRLDKDFSQEMKLAVRSAVASVSLALE